ncbi:MAG: helix-turn-helix transcriptional regulator [Chitinophagaceae bacterium]
MKELSRAQVANLISHLIERGITVESLSEASGVSQPVIIMIMKGQLRPSPEIRKSLASALGIRTDLLV